MNEELQRWEELEARLDSIIEQLTTDLELYIDE